MGTPQRKDDHIRFALENDVQCRASAGFDDVTLIHSSLPEMDLEDIRTETSLLGKKMDYPFIISAITGGSERAEGINKDLAILAERHNIGMSVGSQRAMIENESLRGTYEIRKYAPDILLFSNLGLAQIIGMDNGSISSLIDSIGADALAVHLNPLQEVLQPEGDTTFKGGLQRLRELKDDLGCPVIVKETGAGISMEVARLLSFLDGAEISGVGGTSFAAVEYYRAKNALQKHTANLFWDWGIPTVPSIIETKKHISTIIASGGVRNGMHIAKCLVLGASCAGLAQPFLSAVYNRPLTQASEYLDRMVHELRTTMFLTGADSVDELKSLPAVFHGRTREYLEERGFDLKQFSQRGV